MHSQKPKSIESHRQIMTVARLAHSSFAWPLRWSRHPSVINNTEVIDS